MNAPLYLLDTDTGRVICGPVAHGDALDHVHVVDAYRFRYPHLRLGVGPMPDAEPDPGAHERAIAARHGLPHDVLHWSVTLRERTGDDVLRAYDTCTGGAWCQAGPLVLVTWHGRNDVRQAHGVGPRMWWRRVLCVGHLAAPLRALIDRARLDPGCPDAPWDIAVLVAVGPEWGIRWPAGHVTTQPSRAEAVRVAALACDSGQGVVVTRPNPAAEWAEPAAVTA